MHNGPIRCPDLVQDERAWQALAQRPEQGEPLLVLRRTTPAPRDG